MPRTRLIRLQAVKGLLLLLGPGLLCGRQAPPAAPGTLVYEHKPLRIPLRCSAAILEAAGIECSEEEPCRMLLELTAVEAVGPKVLIVGNIHTPSATVSSLALMSDDAGTQWREPLERLPGAAFEGAQFLNEQQGWISVQPQSQFATDPYLLATTDGGAHWEKLPIWHEEGRAGALLQFYFDSRNHGFAIIDRLENGPGYSRYELYETPNGGATWMLHETSSRPIAPKWPARRPSEWRLREDSKLKTYELERRVGGGWSRMANFWTDLGVCKQPEPKAAPEAPPAPANPANTRNP